MKSQVLNKVHRVTKKLTLPLMMKKMEKKKWLRMITGIN